MCYPDEVKAQVMAALLAGQSVTEVAKAYKIPLGTVKVWKHRAMVSPVSQVSADKKADIGDLLIDYLHAALGTLRKQLEVFSDATWLTKQPASEAAVLHGVLADKTIRLLEALVGSEEE